MNKKQAIRIIEYVVAGLALVALLLGIFSPLSLLESARIVFGSVYVLFLPGFVISYFFFNSEQIDWLERIAISFALSIAIVPLVVFYLNLVGIRISAINTTLIIALLLAISGYFHYRKHKFGQYFWFKKQ